MKSTVLIPVLSQCDNVFISRFVNTLMCIVSLSLGSVVSLIKISLNVTVCLLAGWLILYFVYLNFKV